jgi:serine/threonine protein phosphatase 1
MPEGQRIYAIGDVHGQIDLLEALLEKIASLEAKLPPARTTELFLGDYVDRGSASMQVIGRLAEPLECGRQRICLRGNHEAAMQAFLDDPNMFDPWRAIGGLDTLASYGLPRRLPRERSGLMQMWRAFSLAVPAAHKAFLSRLPLMHEAGSYLFVHAGVRPGRPLAEQSEHDLMWIRSEFLESEASFGPIVVHGHTPGTQVVFRRNRIGVDTGAYATRRLSCVVLQDDKAFVLQARPDFSGIVTESNILLG